MDKKILLLITAGVGVVILVAKGFVESKKEEVNKLPSIPKPRVIKIPIQSILRRKFLAFLKTLKDRGYVVSDSNYNMLVKFVGDIPNKQIVEKMEDLIESIMYEDFEENIFDPASQDNIMAMAKEFARANNIQYNSV